jgi:hypothetical protein
LLMMGVIAEAPEPSISAIADLLRSGNHCLLRDG